MTQHDEFCRCRSCKPVLDDPMHAKLEYFAMVERNERQRRQNSPNWLPMVLVGCIAFWIAVWAIVVAW